MLEIDGSEGEGGGQILRTAVAMASIHGTPVKVYNIRANRPKPGLSAQHLSAIKGVAEMCDGDIRGAEKGATEITFVPGDIRGGKYRFDIGTAGSVTLMLQALIPVAIRGDKAVKIRLKGGTDVKWSPPYDYFENVFLEQLKRLGCKVESKLIKRGHYPKGGGEVEVHVSPGDIHGYDTPKEADTVSIEGKVFVSNLPMDIAKRMKKAALKELIGSDVSIATEEHTTLSPGTGITLWTTGGRILGCGVLGEKGVPADILGKKCAETLSDDINSGVDLDPWCADQLVPYLSLIEGNGKFEVRYPSEHLRTNIDLVNKFKDCVSLKEGEKVVIEYYG